jgi:dCTP deaminase
MKSEESKANYQMIPSAFLGDKEILFLLQSGNLEIEPRESEFLSCNKIELRVSDSFIRLRSTRDVFDCDDSQDASRFFRRENCPEFIIHPDERVLMCTMERIRLPRDVLGIVSLKSSYSRLGLQANVGWVDPGFVGQLTLEISGSSFPVKIHSGQSLFHMILARAGSCSRTYSGKYQNQLGPTPCSFRKRPEP